MSTREILRTVFLLAAVLCLYNGLVFFEIDKKIGEHLFRSLVFGMIVFPFYWGFKLLLTLHCTIACSLEDKIGNIFWLEGVADFHKKFKWKRETNDR